MIVLLHIHFRKLFHQDLCLKLTLHTLSTNPRNFLIIHRIIKILFFVKDLLKTSSSKYLRGGIKSLA